MFIEFVFCSDQPQEAAASKEAPPPLHRPHSLADDADNADNEASQSTPMDLRAEGKRRVVPPNRNDWGSPQSVHDDTVFECVAASRAYRYNADGVRYHDELQKLQRVTGKQGEHLHSDYRRIRALERELGVLRREVADLRRQLRQLASAQAPARAAEPGRAQRSDDRGRDRFSRTDHRDHRDRGGYTVVRGGSRRGK